MVYDQRYWNAAGMVTAHQAAALFGVKEDTVHKWRTRGHLVGQRVGRSWMFWPSDIEAAVRERLPQLL